MEKIDLHVIFSSDIHYSDQIRTYGVKMDDRMQHWVDSILAEHKKEPIDLLVITGDISQDFWEHKQWAPETGNCVLCGMESTIPNLVDRYLNTLRQYFPVYVMPGNHDQYTNDEWYGLVGNARQGSMIIGNILFLFMDNFKVMEPPTVCGGSLYTATDVAYIHEMLEQYPNHDVYLVAHYFDTVEKDGEVLIESALQELLVGNERIKGLFAGHTHGSRVQNLGSEWGNKTIAQTGNFSFNFPSSSTDLPFWGFREFIVTSDTAYSQYISVEGIANDANTASYTRTISDFVRYGMDQMRTTKEADFMNFWTQSKDNIWVAAHRGWCSKYPENTMEAIKAAVEVGVDQIETDIRVTKDGELVLFHDPTVDRTTNGTGKVIDFTLEELRALDAGIHKGEEFKGYKVPTFIEFMDYMKTLPEITIDIELKEYPIDGHDAIAYDVCDRVLKIVDEYGFTDRVVINSFSNKLNEYVHEKYGDKYKQHVFYPMHVLQGEPAIDPYSYAYCCCVIGGELISTQAACDYLTNRGVEPWAGAEIKDEAAVDLVIERGVTLITCNNPDVVLDLLRKKGKRTK